MDRKQKLSKMKIRSVLRKIFNRLDDCSFLNVSGSLKHMGMKPPVGTVLKEASRQLI